MIFSQRVGMWCIVEVCSGGFVSNFRSLMRLRPQYWKFVFIYSVDEFAILGYWDSEILFLSWGGC